MKQFLLTTIFLLLFLTGCANSSQQIDSCVPIQTEQNFTKDFLTADPASQAPSAASLAISPGTYLSIYTDETTGSYLDYYLYIPVNAGENMPLFIFLHGDGEVGQIEELENYGMMKKAKQYFGDEFPFIAIQPCTRIPTWYDQGVPETLKSLIDTVVSNYKIDTNRIVLTGHSRGSMGIWYLVDRYVDYFAAAVPVSGAAVLPFQAKNFKNTPIFAICGDGDYFERSYSLDMQLNVKAVNEAGGCAEMIILKDTTHIETDDDAYSEATFIWMLQQRKEPENEKVP